MGSTARTRRPVAGWLALLAACTLPGCAAAWAAAAPPPEPARERRVILARPLEIKHPALEARARELTRRSPTWRAAMDSLASTGFWVVVGTPADIRRGVPGLENYRSRHLGEVVPLRDRDGTLTGAIVTIDLEMLERLGVHAGVTRAELKGDIDRILVHEIYGHVLPLAWTLEIVGGCPDPAPGAPAESSCAIQRENRIRHELGMEPRIAYDLSGLSIGRAGARAVGASR